MVKKTESKPKAKVVKKVLITQPKPEGEKSPYFDLAKKYGIELDFHPFIVIEGIPAKDFRKQKIEKNWQNIGQKISLCSFRNKGLCLLGFIGIST